MLLHTSILYVLRIKPYVNPQVDMEDDEEDGHEEGGQEGGEGSSSSRTLWSKPPDRSASEDARDRPTVRRLVPDLPTPVRGRQAATGTFWHLSGSSRLLEPIARQSGAR